MTIIDQDTLQDPGFTSEWTVLNGVDEMRRTITAIAGDFLEDFDVDEIESECWDICQECTILAEDGSPLPGEHYLIETTKIYEVMQRNEI